MKNIKNEEAVSPVIGVILMVVITVIVAAILAVFAFGIGAPTKAPEAKLRFTAVANVSSGAFDFKVNHAGGDSLILKDEQLIIKNAVTDIVGSIVVNSTAPNGKPMYPTYFNETTLAPGFTISANMSGVTRGDIIVVQVMDVPTGQMVTDTKITVQ